MSRPEFYVSNSFVYFVIFGSLVFILRYLFTLVFNRILCKAMCQVFLLQVSARNVRHLRGVPRLHSTFTAPHLTTSPCKRSPLAVRNCSQLHRSHQNSHMSVSISTPYHLPFDWPGAITSTPPLAAGAGTVPGFHPILSNTFITSKFYFYNCSYLQIQSTVYQWK